MIASERLRMIALLVLWCRFAFDGASLEPAVTVFI
jgi:hypothetical protein